MIVIIINTIIIHHIHGIIQRTTNIIIRYRCGGGDLIGRHLIQERSKGVPSARGRLLLLLLLLLQLLLILLLLQLLLLLTQCLELCLQLLQSGRITTATITTTTTTNSSSSICVLGVVVHPSITKRRRNLSRTGSLDIIHLSMMMGLQQAQGSLILLGLLLLIQQLLL